ncbi:OmpH family outer membrane protein [Helicobacter bizzozeronii]|uniref:OmpH family outer membrane protein n=1 Tax=Helicobacter bizzozeronii TaxID=56877 RepID=UPI000CEF0BD2|nr:OmpH family outer membrane protein [Helicobacter bizzozeronii]
MTSNFSARYFLVSASLLSALGAEVGDVRNGFFVGASMGARSMSIAQAHKEPITSSVGNYFRTSKLYKAGFAAQNLQTLKESLQNLVKKLADLDAKIQAAAKTKDFKDLKALDLPNLDALEKNVADAIAQLKAQNNPDLNKALEGYSNALDELKAYGAGLLKEASDYNKDLGEAQGKYDTAVKNYQTEEAKHKVAVQQAEAKYEAEVKKYNAAKTSYDTAVQQARDTYNAAKAKYDADVQQAKNDYTSDMQKYNTAIDSYGDAKKKYGNARTPLYKNLTNPLSRFERVTGSKNEHQAKIREIVGRDYNGSLAEIKKAVKDNLDNLKTLSEVNYKGETVRYSADSSVKQGSWEAKQRVFSWSDYNDAWNIGAHLRQVGRKPTKDQGICGIHGSFDACVSRFENSSNFADYSLENLTQLYAWMQDELNEVLTKYQDVDRLAKILSLYHDKSFDAGMVGGFGEKLGKSLPAPDAVFDSQIAQPTQATFTKPTLNLPNAFSDPKPTLNLPDFKATAPTAPTLNFNPSDMSGKIASVGQQVDGLPKAVSIPPPTQTPKPTASNPPTPQVPSKPQPHD